MYDTTGYFIGFKSQEYDFKDKNGYKIKQPIKLNKYFIDQLYDVRRRNPDCDIIMGLDYCDPITPFGYIFLSGDNRYKSNVGGNPETYENELLGGVIPWEHKNVFLDDYRQLELELRAIRNLDFRMYEYLLNFFFPLDGKDQFGRELVDTVFVCNFKDNKLNKVDLYINKSTTTLMYSDTTKSMLEMYELYPEELYQYYKKLERIYNGEKPWLDSPSEN